MFSRVVACAIAALLFVVQAASCGEPNPTAAVRTPAITVGTIEISHEQAQVQTDVQTQVQTQAAAQDQVQDHAQNLSNDQTRDDIRAQPQVAAIDPAEFSDRSPAGAQPSIRSGNIAEPFGLKAIPVSGGALFMKWAGVENAIHAESDILARCRSGAAECPSAARNFLDIVAQGRARAGRARIGTINRAINLAIRPMSDLAQWGVIDRWSPPLETLTTGLGDCEDYAIAKYVALTAAGVDAQDVRLVIVRDLAVGEDHAVAAVRLDGEWIVLDNRWLTMVDDTEMRRMVPLFVIDQSGVRQFAPATAAAAQRAAAPHEAAAAAPGATGF